VNQRRPSASPHEILADASDDGRAEGANAAPILESVRETVAARLRIARELAGLSQGQVAKLLKLHRPTVTEIEAGRRRVSADELREFAHHYRTSVGWLTGEESDVSDPMDDRIRLAARELGKLSQEDLDRVLRVLATVRARGNSAE
jgi:transcriptional regulator with XRE-family HTH domain